MNAVVLRSGGGRPAVIAVRQRSMRSGSGRGPVAAVGVRRHLGAGYQHRHPTLAGTAAVLQDVACSGPAREWAIRLHLSHGPPLRLRGRMPPALIGWQQSPLLSLRWLWRHLRSPACEGAGGPARGQGLHLRPLRLESRLYTRLRMTGRSSRSAATPWGRVPASHSHTRGDGCRTTGRRL